MYTISIKYYSLVFFIVTILMLLGCNTKQHLQYEKISEKEERISYLERRISELNYHYEYYKDSIAFVLALKEKSQYKGKDSTSFLETSYSISYASLNEGNLIHSLENKDSIPTIIRERWRDKIVTKTDTIIKIDTIVYWKEIEKEEVEIIKKSNFFDDISKILLLILIIGVLVFFIKNFKLLK